MKFEFVDFYPLTDDVARRKVKGLIGTLHIYAIDCELDIRGIRVLKRGKNIFFLFPYLSGTDAETGKLVRYPYIRWTNQKTQEEMMNFLKREVQTKIKEIMKLEV